MSEDQEPREFAGLARSVVSEHARAIASACGEQLSSLLGAPVTARASEVHAIRKDGVADQDSPLLHQLCKTAGETSHPVHVLASRESAATLAGLQLGKSAEEIGALSKQELDADTCSAFQNLMQAVTVPISEALAEAGLQAIEVRDAREIPEPASDPTWLDGSDFVRLRLEFGIEGHPDTRLDVLLPRAEGDGDQALDDVRVIFLECCPDEFDRLEVIASDVAFELAVTQPQAFHDDIEEAAEASAIVIPWDLAGRSGIELLEELRANETLASLRFAMSSNLPSRAQIAAARRAGAVTFLQRPYDREEIERRLVRGLAEDAQASGNKATSSEGAASKA